ncbi:MAG: hypothetical protein NTZ72_03670, partial [Afipia sp.]|nr:hypothetical protein [Afipia sp.]
HQILAASDNVHITARVDLAEIAGDEKSIRAKFKMPKRVIFVDDLPRNTMGKVQKNVLRDTYAKLYKT